MARFRIPIEFSELAIKVNIFAMPQLVTLEEDWEWRSEPADVAEVPAVSMAIKVLRHDPQVRENGWL
jgi:hypothetical protein